MEYLKSSIKKDSNIMQGAKVTPLAIMRFYERYNEKDCKPIKINRAGLIFFI